jgi:hypothetical protein
VKANPDADPDWNRHPNKWDYPADYWNYCPPPIATNPGAYSGFDYWIEPGSYECTTVPGQTHEFVEGSPGYNAHYNSTPWCSKPGCWVSPCTCNLDDMTASSWFKRQSDNGNIYYSYAQCGGTNEFTEALCSGATTQATCEAENGCKFVLATTVGDGASTSTPRGFQAPGDLNIPYHRWTTTPQAAATTATPAPEQLLIPLPGPNDTTTAVAYNVSVNVALPDNGAIQSSIILAYLSLSFLFL